MPGESDSLQEALPPGSLPKSSLRWGAILLHTSFRLKMRRFLQTMYDNVECIIYQKQFTDIRSAEGKYVLQHFLFDMK